MLPAQALKEGSRYSVSFWASDAGLSDTASSHGDWVAYFIGGDPESVQTRNEACP